MFKKTKCNNCYKEFDEVEDQCPYCKTANSNKPKGWSFKMMTFVGKGKQLAIFFVGWLGLQFLATFVSLIIVLTSSTPLDPSGTTITSLENFLAQIIPYTLLTAILLWILGKENKKVFSSFKNPFSYLGFVAGGVIIGLGILYGLFSSQFGTGGNESAVRDLITFSPAGTFFMIVLMGPICEEITYRLGLYSFLRRKSMLLAVLITSLIFALIHFDINAIIYLVDPAGEAGMELFKNAIIIELVNLPNYLIAGACLSLTYEYLGFAGSFLAHLTNNFVAWIQYVVPSATAVLFPLFLK